MSIIFSQYLELTARPDQEKLEDRRECVNAEKHEMNIVISKLW